MDSTYERGVIWSDEETKALISIWGDKKILEKLDVVHRNSEIYSSIAEDLEKRGFKRDWKQCRRKCKNLKTSYKLYKDAAGKSGGSRKKVPKFFDLLDSFLGDRPEAVGLEYAVDSSMASENTNEETSVCK